MKNLKIKKPLQKEDEEKYSQWANWCNENQYQIKDDNPDYYYVKKFEISQENLVEHLRSQRENKCFSIINRGKIWYDTLTPEQVQQLNDWYIEWLDVTSTMNEPITPEWIK